MKTFQDKITAARARARLTQKQTAELLGVTQQTVSRWCAGAYEPSKLMQAAVLEKIKGVIAPK